MHQNVAFCGNGLKEVENETKAISPLPHNPGFESFGEKDSEYVLGEKERDTGNQHFLKCFLLLNNIFY